MPASNCIFRARFCIVLRLLSLNPPYTKSVHGETSDETVTSCSAVHKRFGAVTGQTTCIRTRKRLRRHDHIRLKRWRKPLGNLGLETFDSHDESMEVTKDLWKNCSSVLLTLNQNNADEHRHAEP